MTQLKASVETNVKNGNNKHAYVYILHNVHFITNLKEQKRGQIVLDFCNSHF